MRLETVFLNDPFPTQEVRAELAEKLGTSPRCVQIWFQNRRQKWKELHTLHDEVSVPFKKLWQRRENAIAAAKTAAPAVKQAMEHAAEHAAPVLAAAAPLPIRPSPSSHSTVTQMNQSAAMQMHAFPHEVRGDLQAFQSHHAQMDAHTHMNELHPISSLGVAHQKARGLDEHLHAAPWLSRPTASQFMSGSGLMLPSGAHGQDPLATHPSSLLANPDTLSKPFGAFTNISQWPSSALSGQLLHAPHGSMIHLPSSPSQMPTQWGVGLEASPRMLHQRTPAMLPHSRQAAPLHAANSWEHLRGPGGYASTPGGGMVDTLNGWSYPQSRHGVAQPFSPVPVAEAVPSITVPYSAGQAAYVPNGEGLACPGSQQSVAQLLPPPQPTSVVVARQCR